MRECCVHGRSRSARSTTILVPAMDPTQRANFGGVSMYGVDTGEPVQLVTLDAFDLPALSLSEGGRRRHGDGSPGKAHARRIEMYRPLMYVENDREQRSQELLSLVLGMDYAAYWHCHCSSIRDNLDGDTEDIFPGTVSVNILCIPNEAQPNCRACNNPSRDETWRECYENTIRPISGRAGIPLKSSDNILGAGADPVPARQEAGINRRRRGPAGASESVVHAAEDTARHLLQLSAYSRLRLLGESARETRELGREIRETSLRRSSFERGR